MFIAYIASVLGTALLELLPYVEELIRGLRAGHPEAERR